MCLGLSTMYNVYTVNKNDSFACTKKLQNMRIEKIMQRIKKLKVEHGKFTFCLLFRKHSIQFFYVFSRKKLL